MFEWREQKAFSVLVKLFGNGVSNQSRAAAHFLSLFASSGKGFRVRWMPLLSVPFVDELKLESASTPALQKYSSGQDRGNTVGIFA